MNATVWSGVLAVWIVVLAVFSTGWVIGNGMGQRRVIVLWEQSMDRMKQICLGREENRDDK